MEMIRRGFLHCVKVTSILTWVWSISSTGKLSAIGSCQTSPLQRLSWPPRSGRSSPCPAPCCRPRLFCLNIEKTNFPTPDRSSYSARAKKKSVTLIWRTSWKEVQGEYFGSPLKPIFWGDWGSKIIPLKSSSRLLLAARLQYQAGCWGSWQLEEALWFSQWSNWVDPKFTPTTSPSTTLDKQFCWSGPVFGTTFPRW